MSLESLRQSYEQRLRGICAAYAALPAKLLDDEALMCLAEIGSSSDELGERIAEIVQATLASEQEEAMAMLQVRLAQREAETAKLAGELSGLAAAQHYHLSQISAWLRLCGMKPSACRFAGGLAAASAAQRSRKLP